MDVKNIENISVIKKIVIDGEDQKRIFSDEAACIDELWTVVVFSLWLSDNHNDRKKYEMN